MKIIIALSVLAISTSFAQVGRLEIPQQTGPSTGNRTTRAVVPSANDLLGFDANKKLTNIPPATILANGSLSNVKHATITVSSADLLALYSAPKLLIAAPGAGHFISIVKLQFAITRTSTAYITGGGAAIVQYDSTTHGGGTQACDSTIAATVITGSAGLSNTIRNGAIISDSGALDNKGIYLSAATGDFTAGTGTAVVDVLYTYN